MDKKSIYNNSILLIGPIGVGKSMLAKALSQKSGLPVITLDKLRNYYYQKFGYDVDTAKKAQQTNGADGWYEYQKPFELELAVEVLNNHISQPSIIDLGAGFTVFENRRMFNELFRAMKPYKNIFNLELPNNYKSYNEKAKTELNVHFKQNNCNYTLASFNLCVDVVDQNGQTYEFNENKFNSLVKNIMSVSGVKAKEEGKS